MRKTVAKRLRKRATELWAAAKKKNKKLAQREGGYVRWHIVNLIMTDHEGKENPVGQTATLVSKGARRLYRNLKWSYRHYGKLTEALEEASLQNAIQWTLAKT
jgi:hypothetical protein